MSDRVEAAAGNLPSTNERRANLAITTHSQKATIGSRLNFAYLQCPCPNSLSGKCPKEAKQWYCNQCGDILEYDIDAKVIYCSCGNEYLSSYQFKCDSENHGDAYAQFSDDALKNIIEKNIIAKLVPIKCYNLLLLGETGVGKSTWINGIANYASFLTLEDALKTAKESVPVFLIPTAFNIQDPETYQNYSVKVGESDNENTTDTALSGTLEPRAYRLRFGEKHIRLIDTPGFGDTRGIEQHKRNMQHIMSYLSHYDVIHGICFLLTPGKSKLTESFQFCLNELLNNLHVDAAKNIVFCFTHSRETQYTPGDAIKPLKDILSQIKNPSSSEVPLCIKATRETIFCFDSECFRYICASHNGINLLDSEFDTFSKSWNQSVKETTRLLERITTLPPHQLEGTISLNAARKIITELSQPLAEICVHIGNNINSAKRQMDEFRKDPKKWDTNMKYTITLADLSVADFPYPRVVCTSSRCTHKGKSEITGEEKVVYDQICCEACSYNWITYVVPGWILKRFCDAFEDGICKKCGCAQDRHKYLTWTFEEVKKEELIGQFSEEYLKRANKESVIEALVRNFDKLIRVLDGEIETILECAAQFDAFQREYSMAAYMYKDAFRDHITFLIEYEEKFERNSDERLQFLKTLDESYQLAVTRIQLNITEKSISRPPSDIFEIVDVLKALTRNGYMIKSVHDKAKDAARSFSARSETIHRIRNSYERIKNFVGKIPTKFLSQSLPV